MIDTRGYRFFKKVGKNDFHLISYHRRDSLTWRFILHFGSSTGMSKMFYIIKIHQGKRLMWGLKLPFGHSLMYTSQLNMSIKESK